MIYFCKESLMGTAGVLNKSLLKKKICYSGSNVNTNHGAAIIGYSTSYEPLFLLSTHYSALVLLEGEFP